MSAGFFAEARHHYMATFEASIRRLPRNRDWLVVAGIERAVDYLLNLSYTEAEIDYLRGLRQLKNAPPGFFDYLRDFRFTGDVDSVPEGTVLFAGEPVLSVRAPLIQAQIPETYLLSAITFESLIATKAARIVDAAGSRSVLEFGTRRAHTPEAGTLGARAAYIGGCVGTSNTLAGFRFGIPVFGTAAHSWVMSFQDESEAFRSLQKLLGDQTVQLIDTYDPIEGARKTAQLGKPLWGVRLDSGDLDKLSREVRRILDNAGLEDARIMVSGDLDEYRIATLVASGAPINSFGVGTELATSADAPAMGMIYKIVELEEEGRRRYTAKNSEGKPSIPGAKQIWRTDQCDRVSLATETVAGAVPLLQPFIRNGRRVAPAESIETIRERATKTRCNQPVHRSAALESVVETMQAHVTRLS
jgi:nicotinate phosphoribosyltransferase